MINKISILVLIVFAVGCGTGFAPDLDFSQLEDNGVLVVQVNDQNGVPVNGVEVQISGRVDLTQVTSDALQAGEVFFLPLEGTYTITINPPDKFRVPARRTVQIKRKGPKPSWNPWVIWTGWALLIQERVKIEKPPENLLS